MNLRPKQIWKHKASGKEHYIAFAKKDEVVTTSLPSEDPHDHGESFFGDMEQFGKEFEFVREGKK
jgi:hypothetical protein